MSLSEPEQKIIKKVRAMGDILRKKEIVSSNSLKKQAATLVVLANELENLGM